MNKTKITENLKSFLDDLESNDDKKIEEAAYRISGALIAWEQELGELAPELLEIENLALDLEIPKQHVQEWNSKLLSLKGKIKSL